MILAIDNIETGYGKKQVLFGISLKMPEGQTVALIGPNGAGKSTVLKAACGLLPVWKGKVQFCGAPINGKPPAQNVARGMTLCPQGSRVFNELTVMENLEIGGLRLSSKNLGSHIDDMLSFFPALKKRLKVEAGKLSGGERQMLSLARALVSTPKLLMLDEPSLGLSPGLVAAVFERVRQINRNTGVAVLIVEQKVREVLKISDHVYGMRLGKVVLDGTPEEVARGDELKRLFLG